MNEAVTRAHVLSNGDYAVLVTEAGGGYASLQGYALTRWQPDPAAVGDGPTCYLRDVESGHYWSLTQGERGGTSATADAIEQWTEAEDVLMHCTIRIARHSNVEVRTIRISNRGSRARRFDLTTYAELSLNTPGADAAHPAFSKLFVQTDHDAGRNALIAWRRKRSPDDQPLWFGQRLTDAVQFETDRARFIGRTRTANDPHALSTPALTGTVGAVLDPAFALRAALALAPGQSIELQWTSCAADTRADLEALLDALLPDEFASAGAIDALGLPEKWLTGLSVAQGSTEWHARAVQTRDPLPDARTEYGSFSDDGSEYVVRVGRDQAPTPQPWINVVANEDFGFLVSERGAGYTWASNSRENRLTAWSNDTTSDPHSEVLFIRDDEDGAEWSPLVGPLSADADYDVHHGFGYSRFLHDSHGLHHDVCLFVAHADPVKITRMRIGNSGPRERRLTIRTCARLVLGGLAADTRATVVTSCDGGVIYARNADRGEFSERVAFAFPICDQPAQRSVTASWHSFAQAGPALDGQCGAGFDPCAALQLTIVLPPGHAFECAFMLGEAADEAAARACVAHYRNLGDVDAALLGVSAYWRELLNGVQVDTPVPALDVMFNGWLAYQNLVCRMWGRSAFYQSGGAFGFRDQLQDSSALLYLNPAITRRQILLHAAHQFVEGDVLHWWHPPANKGIRTRFSDDLLWLPYITLFYMARTGDHAILDEQVRFLTAEPLEEGEDEVFVHPVESGEHASLYEHCCRTIERSLTKGAHGLPLMGVGDWNDGMNRVGRLGKGESVWLGFFIFEILTDFIPVCSARGDHERAQRYTRFMSELHSALNEGGWDGGWYRRAYYDNGAPLGSAQNDECRIDALAQSWAVISGAAPADRAVESIEAMQQHLVAEDDGIIRLLTPAFDKTPHDPGYIKGYIPGVRENGGQYTHAALWAVRAVAEMGLRDRAAALLEMISPATRARDPLVYQGEPYVIAADVYGEPPHVGRAGWTWYTGSAGWMYRVLLESVLGFDLRAGRVLLRPCVPATWPGFSIRYRFDNDTLYVFEVTVSAQASTTSHGAVVDGAIEVPLVSDGEVHVVRINAGPDVVPRYSSITAPLLRTTSA